MSEVQINLMRLARDWDTYVDIEIRKAEAQAAFERLLQVHRPEIWDDYKAARDREAEDEGIPQDDEVQWFFPQNEQEAAQFMAELGKVIDKVPAKQKRPSPPDGEGAWS